MIKRAITRRMLLKKCLTWCSLAALPGLSSACGGRSVGANPQIEREVHNISMKEIGREFSIDLAIINLGGYSHGMPRFMAHLNPKQVVKSFQELQAKHMLIVHWGSFRLTSEPVHFPPIQLKEEMAKAGIADRLLHLDHGETLYYG